MTTLSGFYYIDQIDRHEFHGYALSGSVYSGQSKFQTIEVVESPKFGKMLILDGKIQSAALDEHIYHEALVHPAMLLHPHPRRVLILGGGEGATLREVLRYRMVEEAVMVDLDDEVVRLSRTYLPEWSGKAFEDPRATVVCKDAVDFLDGPVGLFDVIVHDITDRVTGDFAEDYYHAIRQRLPTPGCSPCRARSSISGIVRDTGGFGRRWEGSFPGFTRTGPTCLPFGPIGGLCSRRPPRRSTLWPPGSWRAASASDWDQGRDRAFTDRPCIGRSSPCRRNLRISSARRGLEPGSIPAGFSRRGTSEAIARRGSGDRRGDSPGDGAAGRRA